MAERVQAMANKVADNVPQKVKDVAQQELRDFQRLTDEGARSGAYLYPIKGIYYFAGNRELWKPLMSVLLPALSTALIIFPAMFFFTYVPQAAVLAFINGPFAIFTTVLLVLSEASTIYSVVSKNIVLKDALLDTFDGTLIARGQSSTVARGRDLKSGVSNPISQLGKLRLSSPFPPLSMTALIRHIMYLPLNAIPLVGTALFVILQGKKYGPTAHARYFQLKSMSHEEKAKFVEQRRGAYTSFGIVASLLEMLPVVGLIFTFTNTVGAALWAARLEQGIISPPKLNDNAKKSE